MKLAAIFPTLALLLGACSGAGDGNTGTHAGNCAGEGIIVSDAWMRPARMGQPTSAVYLTICNGTDNEIALTGASFSGADATELHITNMSSDNTASMTHSTELIIAAGSSMTLEPGHAHIMLIGLNNAFAPGDAPHLSLEFKDTRPVTTHMDVRENAPGDQSHH